MSYEWMDRRELTILHADARSRRHELAYRQSDPETYQMLLDDYTERGIGEDGYPFDFPESEKRFD